jgi:hypothetical protein
MAGDGPGQALGVALAVFLAIGAASGVVASALVIGGRSVGWRALHPAIVLPILFLLGFGSYFAYAWSNQKIREARNASPTSSCMDSLHAARLGNVDLHVPIAPGLFLWGTKGRDDHYMLWSNPDTRRFCSNTEGQTVAISEIEFMIDGSPARRQEATRRPFCDRNHPEYPWADMACNLIPTEIMPDSPVRMNVSVPTSNVDWVAKERETMMKYPVSIAADGLKSYQADFYTYLERPDGYFAKCHSPNTPGQPWLYCGVRENSPAGLTVSYDFRTTKELFLRKSLIVEASAHAIFESLKH